MKIIGFLPVSRRAMELLKARNPKLVQRPIIVHGPTGNYTRNAWILPEEAASEKPRAAQFDLFDQGPEPEKQDTALIPSKAMYLRVRGTDQKVRVSSLKDASEKFALVRDEAVRRGVGGGSKTPQIDVVDANGKVLGIVSYNGRIWSPDTHGKEGAKPIYDTATDEERADARAKVDQWAKEARGETPVAIAEKPTDDNKAFREAMREQARRSNKQLFGYDPDDEAAERKYQSTKNTLDAEHKRIMRYDEILKEHAAEKKSGNSGYSIKDRNYYKEKADEAKESMRWYRENWPDQYARWSSETGSDPISSTGKLSAKAAKNSSRWEKTKGAGEFVLKFPDPESGSDMVYGRVYRFDHFNGRPPTYYTSDEKIFETLAEAKKYEWETRSLPDLIRDGYVEANMADNSESDRLEREIAKEHALRKKAAKALFDKAEKNGFDISPDRDPFKEAPRLHSSDVKRILKKLGTNLPTILSSPLQSYIMLVPLFGMYDGMYALKHRPSREDLQKFAAEENKPINLKETKGRQ